MYPQNTRDSSMHAATNYTCAERARRAYNARLSGHISGHMTWRQDA